VQHGIGNRNQRLGAEATALLQGVLVLAHVDDRQEVVCNKTILFLVS
jgi:hypothetical protein